MKDRTSIDIRLIRRVRVIRIATYLGIKTSTLIYRMDRDKIPRDGGWIYIDDLELIISKYL